MSNPPIVLPQNEIEELWFGGLNLKAGQTPGMEAVLRWFRSDQAFDSSCKCLAIFVLYANTRKYQPLVSQLVALPFNDLVALGDSPQESLTLLLLLDQLPRDYARGSPFPFTICDPLAVKLAEHFVFKREYDKQQPPYKRLWYYLPFEHAESLPYQELAIAKFAEACWELREGEWKDFHGLMNEGLEYGWRHYLVIKQFGRFPGRNKTLGRENTEAETKFIEEGGDTFS